MASFEEEVAWQFLERTEEETIQSVRRLVALACRSGEPSVAGFLRWADASLASATPDPDLPALMRHLELTVVDTPADFGRALRVLLEAPAGLT
jgi:hypothetical protein